MKTKKYLTCPQKGWSEMSTSFRGMDKQEMLCTNNEGFGFVVELPDLSPMSDLEKLEWVANEIGVSHHIYHHNGVDGPYEISLFINGQNASAEINFDSNGKLIK